jgi:malignant T-cell-amplified sequence
MPKKEQLDQIKLQVHSLTSLLEESLTFSSPEQRASLYVLPGRPIFFQRMDDAPIAHLKLVHQYPWCFKRIRIDYGAIRFVLSGATLMAPGLTSQGGRLPNPEASEEDIEVYGKGELEVGEIVIVNAEGKEHACLIGPLKMSTKEIKEKKKGVVIDEGHYLGDGLWKMVID